MKIITFDGPDGSGKTTLIENLELKLRMLGKKVLVLRNPGSTKLGEAIRNLILNSEVEMTALVQANLFSVCRLSLIDTIKEVSGKFDYVLIDRWEMSSIAYQWAYAFISGESSETRDQIVNVCMKYSDLSPYADSVHHHLVMADMNVILSRNPVDVNKDRFEKAPVEFRELVYNKYMEIINMRPHSTIILNNTFEDMENWIAVNYND